MEAVWFAAAYWGLRHVASEAALSRRIGEVAAANEVHERMRRLDGAAGELKW